MTSYLKEWESGSCINKVQGELIRNIEQICETESWRGMSVKSEELPKKENESENVDELDEYAKKLDEREQQMKDILLNIEGCRQCIGELKEQHDELLDRTNDFQGRCGSILKEKKMLMDITDELGKSLEFYTGVDNLERNILKKTIITYYTLNNLDSSEYIGKIENIKKKLCEIIEAHLIHICVERYAESFATAKVSSENFIESKVAIYSPIEKFDEVREGFIFFQEFIQSKRVPEYQEVIDNISYTLFAARKNVITKLAEFKINEALQTEQFSLIVEKLLQTQSICVKDEFVFFKYYFLSIEKIAGDITDFFESLIYYYLRPLIIKENVVEELSKAILFTKKAFFDKSLLLIDTSENEDVVDKTFFIKIKQDMQERLLYLLGNYITEKVRNSILVPESKEESKSTLPTGISTVVQSAIEMLILCDNCLDREIVASVSIEIIHPCIAELERQKSNLPH